MNNSADTDQTGRRVGMFSVGLALTVVFGSFAYFSFLLTTMMMDPALHGRDYWAAVGDRFSTDSTFAVMMALFLLIAITGVVLMARAVMRRPSGSEE